MIKVSVIIPFYNQKKEFLKQALDSVLNQTIKDLEVICIDDGSDNFDCFNLVSEIQKIDKRIRLYKQYHLGSGSARNLGIEKSKGENIMFLDSDDFYPDEFCLENLYNLKKQNNILIAGGKHLIYDGEKFEEPYFNFGDINQFFSDKIVKYENYQFPWWYWCFMYDSSLIKSSGILFPPYLRYQDPPFFVRIMEKAEYFYAADFTSYIHRKSDKIYTMTKKMALDHVQGIKNLIIYSKIHNLDKLYNLLKKTFFEFDVVNILVKIESISVDELNNIKESIKNI